MKTKSLHCEVSIVRLSYCLSCNSHTQNTFPNLSKTIEEFEIDP